MCLDTKQFRAEKQDLMTQLHLLNKMPDDTTREVFRFYSLIHTCVHAADGSGFVDEPDAGGNVVSCLEL